MKTATVRAAQPADAAQIKALLPATKATLTNTEDETVLVAEAAGGGGSSAPLLLATLCLRPAIGLSLPRAWFHVGCTVHAASELGLFHRQRTLLLGHDHTGASELAAIGWLRKDIPLADQASALRELVQAALRLIAADRAQFAQRLIVELPGPRDSAGQSPFWQGLGRHFYTGDPLAAAAAHGPAWRSFAAALLPRQTICTSFLPSAAEAAIAQTHTDALLLREVLEEAGLRYGSHVNIEDAGPVLQAQVDDLLLGLKL